MNYFYFTSTRIVSITAQFSDLAQYQAILVNYNNAESRIFEFNYIKSIKSFPSGKINNLPAKIIAPRCEITNIPISFTKASYCSSEITCFGSIDNYEYQLPISWQLNGQTSTGTNWILGTNSETVTSDLSHGDSGKIKIRAINGCDSNLSKGMVNEISISRPEPEMTITGTMKSICNLGDSATFTINGTLPGSTFQWEILDSTLASISGCSTCQSVVVKSESTQNKTVLLKVLISYCGYESTRTFEIGLGLPTFDGGYISGGNWNLINYYTDLPDNPNLICAQAFTTTEFDVFNATSVTWTRTVAIPTNNTWQQFKNGDPLPPLNDDISFYFWGPGQTATFKIKVDNNCGSVIRFYDFVSQDCSGGPEVPCNQFLMSPNPASNVVRIYVPSILPPCDPPIIINSQAKPGTLPNNRKITEIRLYDQMGNIIKKSKINQLKDMNLDISNVKNGVYFVEILDGKYKEKHPLLIKR